MKEIEIYQDKEGELFFATSFTRVFLGIEKD